MGLYGSWSALAVTNHVLIRLAATRLNIDKFEDYMVLGDDVVIFHPQVAQEYVNIMESIGVSTKPEDSIKPCDAHTLEMAKRLFRRGVEVSPLPLRLLRVNLGLFALYVDERGVDFQLAALYPGNLIRIRSLTAATLLMFWKECPP